jgi:hypothetical protein
MPPATLAVALSRTESSDFALRPYRESTAPTVSLVRFAKRS